MPTADRYVSTGGLPGDTTVAGLVQAAYESFRDSGDGAVTDVYPALTRVDPDAFGVCVATTDGRLFEAGDSRRSFTIMSVAKPFVFALTCQAVGVEAIRALVGVNATGLPFNSVQAVEQSSAGRTNPMVNPGATATTSLTPGRSLDDRWQFIADGLSRFAGRELRLDLDVLESALATNHRNRALAALLRSVAGLAGDPDEATELYTRQSSVAAS